jgi:hypothetical protein
VGVAVGSAVHSGGFGTQVTAGVMYFERPNGTVSKSPQVRSSTVTHGPTKDKLTSTIQRTGSAPAESGAVANVYSVRRFSREFGPKSKISGCLAASDHRVLREPSKALPAAPSLGLLPPGLLAACIRNQSCKPAPALKLPICTVAPKSRVLVVRKRR